MLEELKARFAGRLTITLAEAAEVLGVQPEKASRLARQGQFPGAIKMGGRWVVSLPVFANHLDPEGKTKPAVKPVRDQALLERLARIFEEARAGLEEDD